MPTDLKPDKPIKPVPSLVVLGRGLSWARFLLSSATIPTWWTQLPIHDNTLTGRLGGRAACTHAGMDNAQLLELAITSLSQIFSKKPEVVRALLAESYVYNWSKDPFTLGSYAYATVGYQQAQAILKEPIAGRVFFAGEYMYSGTEMGTVEAALWNGRETSKKL